MEVVYLILIGAQVLASLVALVSVVALLPVARRGEAKMGTNNQTHKRLMMMMASSVSVVVLGGVLVVLQFVFGPQPDYLQAGVRILLVGLLERATPGNPETSPPPARLYAVGGLAVASAVLGVLWR